MDRGKFYGCDRYSKDGEGCDFSFSKIIAGHEITSEEAKQIIEGEKTALLQGFVSKKGKTFSARLKLDDEHNIAFEFEKKKSKKKWRNK
ncbi:topoisomerase C-terminal repeat-containing protein [Ligilactobacillus animalis]